MYNNSYKLRWYRGLILVLKFITIFILMERGISMEQYNHYLDEFKKYVSAYDLLNAKIKEP